MYSKPLATSESKGKRYVVTQPQKIPGSRQSFIGFLGERLFFPIILSPLIAIFKDGIIFLILMWIFVIAKAYYDYTELYPPSCPATEKEIQSYKLVQKHDALIMWKKYQGRYCQYDYNGEFEKIGQKLKKIEEEYGPNWKEEFRKDLGYDL